MTTSMHIRGGLILWREVLESSSRREGPPRPTRGYSLSRRFGTREIATWTEGLFCEVEADLSSKLERLRIPGLSAIDVLRPFSSTAIPASLLGFLLQVCCRCCALRGPRFGPGGGIFLGDGDGSAPAPALSAGHAKRALSVTETRTPAHCRPMRGSPPTPRGP